MLSRNAGLLSSAGSFVCRTQPGPIAVPGVKHRIMRHARGHVSMLTALAHWLVLSPSCDEKVVSTLFL